jgi:hypothetical protein
MHGRMNDLEPYKFYKQIRENKKGGKEKARKNEAIKFNIFNLSSIDIAN